MEQTGEDSRWVQRLGEDVGAEGKGGERNGGTNNKWQRWSCWRIGLWGSGWSCWWDFGWMMGNDGMVFFLKTSRTLLHSLVQ